MEYTPQTWWNENAEKRLGEFKEWVGDANAPSKRYMALYLKEQKDDPYYTLADAGCGNGTFYDTLYNERVNIHYTGIDSCQYFIDMNKNRGIPMIDADIRNTGLSDRKFDIVFSRHTFEHQNHVNDIMLELIRISKREMCHIFFIKPSDTDTDIINWDANTNLYHNTYSRSMIEKTLSTHSRVLHWKWVNLNEQECALHVYLK
jgi:ubiquinone/menaquinone biosynthesis C-methylase UbiE